LDYSDLIRGLIVDELKQGTPPLHIQESKLQSYEPPAIVYETTISTRAGSPVSVFRPEQDPADIWSK
jgi:hypothetical protein